MRRPARGGRLRVCVIGSGTRFLSGISVYTNRLANSLARDHVVSVILMRRLLPARLYPGARRVGRPLDRLQYVPGVHVFDGVDWYWGSSIVAVTRFLLRERPQVLIFQWWSGTVLHSYLAIAIIGSLLGARIVIEFHEGLDTAEDRIPLAGPYVRLIAPLVLGLAHGFAFHAQPEVDAIAGRYHLPRAAIQVLPHGPHDHYRSGRDSQAVPRRDAPRGVCNILFFGVIRPYKGLEDLVRAFERLCEGESEAYWLTVVGETWEGWTLPIELIEASRWRPRITLINHYVHDDEVAPVFNGADVVALPYRRSAISGPVHVAMAFGKPLVVTPVGGLAESVEGYGGVVFTEPSDVPALARAISTARSLVGGSFTHPSSWAETSDAYNRLFERLSLTARSVALRDLPSRVDDA